jgi:hypothetical protein
VGAPPPPPAPASGSASSYLIEFTSLRLMLDKGIITQAEYESAVHDLAETSGRHAADEGTIVMGKWATTLYGFVEGDYIYDDTRSFNDLAGATLVARNGTQAGDNGRMQMGVRNSRIGVRMKAPEVSGIRTSAMLEMDFLGTQLPIGYVGATGTGSEAAYFQNPTFRVRHANFKIETPVVDFLVGQYWTLFGWGSMYQPNSVEIQGLPGEVYQRVPQLRISKTIKADPVTVEIAVAATRPIQRDSATPDGQGGIRFALDSWTGVQTVGSTGTQIAPISVGVSGLARHVAVDAFSAAPNKTNDLGLSAVAVDAYLPVIPGSKHHRDNALSLNGEFTTGYGYADMFTNLNGGVGFPALPTGAAYTPDIDPGIVSYNGTGLHGVGYSTYMLGLQYYFPFVDGKIWVSGNYTITHTNNMSDFAGTTGGNWATTPAKALDTYTFYDANLFFDPHPSIRVGIEYARFNTKYYDGVLANNNRGQLSGWFIF